MKTPREIISSVLRWLVLCVSLVCLSCCAAGHDEWTAWIGLAKMSFPTALCLSALSMAGLCERKAA